LFFISSEKTSIQEIDQITFVLNRFTNEEDRGGHGRSIPGNVDLMSLRQKHDRQESTNAREGSLQRTRGERACGRRGPLGRQIERLCETTAQFTAVGFHGRSEVCTVALQTGGLHFCRIFTLRIFSLSLSLSLSLLILAAHFLTLQMKSISFGTNFSFHSSPLPVLGSVFSFILANFLDNKKNFFFGNKWCQATTL
jgi:hypothetical protein